MALAVFAVFCSEISAGKVPMVAGIDAYITRMQFCQLP
jgi:hypothetical protein